MTVSATLGRVRLREELTRLAVPVLDQIKEHPFWTGLCEGSLPPAALWYFAEQDARYVVPAYARALARCAANPAEDAHATMLCGAASATFGSLPRLAEELAALAAQLGTPPGPAPVGPRIHAYTTFMRAAAEDSLAAGVGALLPMSWFHLLVSGEVVQRCRPGSRYAGWIEQYRPFDGYRDYVESFLDLVEAVAEDCTPAERAKLLDHFLVGARHEWAFADTAWHQDSWPV